MLLAHSKTYLKNSEQQILVQALYKYKTIDRQFACKLRFFCYRWCRYIPLFPNNSRNFSSDKFAFF